jgi:hypothetical protein
VRIFTAASFRKDVSLEYGTSRERQEAFPRLVRECSTSLTLIPVTHSWPTPILFAQDPAIDIESTEENCGCFRGMVGAKQLTNRRIQNGFECDFKTLTR